MPDTSRGLSREQVLATDPNAFNRPSRGAYRPPEYRDRTGAQLNRAPLPMQTEPQTLVVVGGRVLHAG